jgi:iron complex outermembrane receptor protein
MPGPGSRQFAHSALAQARFLGRASYRATVGTGWIEGYASLLARRDHFRDYSATVVPGLVIDARSVGTSVEAGALGVLGGSGLRVEPVVRGRYEWFDTAGAVEGRLLARRAGLLAGAEVSVTRGPLELVPALAVEAMRDEASGARMDTTRLLVSPRLGARVALGGGVEVRANLARMQRAPTLPELFGVATYLLGNDTLRPETSANADAGMVAVLPARGWDLRLEGSGFARRVEDLIVLVRSGVLSLKPLNLRDADVLGAEASVRASFRRAVALTASYAYTHALTRAPGTPADGLRVPSIPAHDLFARVEGTHGPLRAWMDLSYVSEIFFDEANLTPAPPRLLLSAAVALTLPFARAATLTAQGTNLLDQREAVVTITSGTRYDVHQPLADFAGYPLPGRALFLALTVATEPSP